MSGTQPAVIAPSGISPDDIPSAALTDALTHIRRLQADNLELGARIAELEADAAMQHGTLRVPATLRAAWAKRQLDDQARYTHDVPPNAPPHGETAE